MSERVVRVKKRERVTIAEASRSTRILCNLFCIITNNFINYDTLSDR
jgi:hypothetical protein